MAERKTDRRTIMTKSIIKESLLELLEKITYEKITITALCKQSDITRATFYLHYGNMDEVLDELLDDALRLTELDDHARTNLNSDDLDSFLPACQRAAAEPKYTILFLDDTLSHIILDKLYHREHDKQIKLLMSTYNLSEWEADKLFLYTLHGSFAVNKSLGWEKNKEWYEAQEVISRTIKPKEKE